MKVQVVQLPRLLEPSHLEDRTIVVFDVLRATTTITAALEAGVTEIRIFGSTTEALAAAGTFEGRRLLIGEQNALPPAGFDLGNSPGDLSLDKHAGMTVFMATTNGTRAIVAARTAPVVLIGCLLNAFAVAQQLKTIGRDVTLLCSGTEGEPAKEDSIGAGAVLDSLLKLGNAEADGEVATMARELFTEAADTLPDALAATKGGQNVIRVGLQKDITFAARLDAMSVVGRVSDRPLRVTEQ
jgi:2-phosphosulfolactate phosphatase